MSNRLIADSTYGSVIRAPIGQLDLSEWLFTLSDKVLATDGFLSLLQAGGVTLEQVASVAQQKADDHNREEAPLFAKNIERKARQGAWAPNA